MNASADMTDARAEKRHRHPRRELYTAGDVQVRPARGVESKGADVIWVGSRLHLQVAIETDERMYFLRGAFMLRLHEDGGLSVARSELLDLDGFGESAKEAIDDFCENFDVQYRALAEEENEEALTPGARAVRRALIDVVVHVEKLG